MTQVSNSCKFPSTIFHSLINILQQNWEPKEIPTPRELLPHLLRLSSRNNRADRNYPALRAGTI